MEKVAHKKEQNTTSLIDMINTNNQTVEKIVNRYLKDGMNLLDIGCWNGKFLNMVSKALPGVKISGVDLEDQALSIARVAMPAGNFTNGSVYNLQLSEGSFDVATFWAVIEHLPKGREIEALKDIYKVLKPGGCLFLMTEYNHPLSKLFDPAYFLIGHRHYSKEQLAKMLNAAGFVVGKMITKGGFWEGFSILSMYFFKHILRRPFKNWYFDERVIDEYRGTGFNLIYVIARKSATEFRKELL